MRRVALALLCLVALCGAAAAQAPALRTGVVLKTTPAPAASGGCSQATTFIARTSGLSGIQTNNLTTMICGMVLDGVGCSSWGTGGSFDAFYFFAINTTTTANLNLCSTSFGLTQGGTVTFSADHGYTGGGAVTDFLDTGYVPSTAGGNLTLNSVIIGAYVLSSRTTANAGAAVGTTSPGTWLYFQPLVNQSGVVFSYGINDAAFTTIANANAQGHWSAVRTGATTTTVYKNGASFGTGTAASVSLPSTSEYILNIHTISAGMTDQLMAAYIGGGVNSTQAAAIDARINAFATALGINVH